MPLEPISQFFRQPRLWQPRQPRREHPYTALILAVLITTLLLAGLPAFAMPVLEAVLDSPAADPFSEFGSAIALDGNRLAVGAPGWSDPAAEALHQGAAYIYDGSGGSWQLEATLFAVDGDNEDFFGRAVAIDDQTLVVGASAESDAIGGQLMRGAAYIFELGAGTWTQVARLDAGAHESAFNYFGSAVAIDGTTVAVGAPGDDADMGAVHIFEKVGSTWNATARIEGDDPASRFGSSVSLDGDILSVAERGGTQWRVYRRETSGWNETSRFFDAAEGFAGGLGAGGLGANAYRAVIGAQGDDLTAAGEVHFFGVEGADWQLEEVTSASSTLPRDRFGAAVALDGHQALVGAPGRQIGGQSAAGSAYLFSRDLAGDWQESATLDGGQVANLRFGSAVALDGQVLAIGAPGHATAEMNDGRVSIYRMPRVARFAVSATHGCAPLTVTFTDESAGEITSRVWDVDGDGSPDYTNPGVSFTHTYTNAGTYGATLTVTGADGSDADLRTIIVGNAAPTADFVATPTSGAIPLTVTFTDQSAGAIVERRWDFDGDGIVDLMGNSTQAQFTFTQEGTYSPKLEAINSCGADSRERVGYVQATAPAVPLIQNPSFEDDGLIIAGQTGRVDQGNPISVWQVSNPAKAGRNTKTGGLPYYNNGLGPDGDVAAFLKDATISQTVAGFQAGQNYRLTFHVNGRAGYPTPQMVVRLGGNTLLDVAVPPKEPFGSFTQPFHVITTETIPGAGSHLLEIEQTAGAYPGLVIDFVEIELAPPPPPVPLIQNPSFEANGPTINGFSGRVDQNNPIAVWQVSDPAKAGRNTNNGWPYYNNGIGPDGMVAAFLKDATISQTVTGFQAGETYRLTFHVNGRAGYPTPHMVARLGGKTLLNVAVPPKESAASFTQPFHVFTADVAPGAGAHLLEIEQTAGALPGLVIDFVDIAIAPSEPIILNPSFEANDTVIYGSSGRVDQGNPIDVWHVSSPAKAGRNTQSGWPYYNNGVGPDGEVAVFLKDATLSQTLHHFEAGKTYRITVHVNGRVNFPTPQMTVRLGSHVVIQGAVPAREPANVFTLPFYIMSGTVTPGAGSHLLEIEQTAGSLPGLVIDFVEIEEL